MNSSTWQNLGVVFRGLSSNDSMIENIYTFPKTGEQFTCANAKATNEAADWYAYFPSNDVKLTGQDGTLNVSSHDSGHLVKVIPGQNHLRYYKERLLFLKL